MAKLTEHIINLIKKQIKEKGIVVWYDPDRSYADLARSLELPETTVLYYTDSFFRLRKEIDTWMEYLNRDDRPVENCNVPPRLLIYLPLERRDTANALIEVETAGSIMEPGAGVMDRNTRLRVVAESVFRTVAPDQAEKIAGQIDAGVLTLAELDNIADEVESVGSSVIKLIFEVTAPHEILLRFAASDKYDAAIINKNALSEVIDLLAKISGLTCPQEKTPTGVRKALQTHLLLTDFLSRFPENTRPSSLSFITIPELPGQIETAGNICETWRNRADLSDAYIAAAKAVEQDAGLHEAEFLNADTLNAFLDAATFSILEQKLIEHCEFLLLKGNTSEALKIEEQRRVSFWAIREPGYQLRWSIIQNAAQVLLLGDSIRTELKKFPKSPAEMIKRYVDIQNPWYLVDTCYRRLEHHYALFDLDISGNHDTLQEVMTRVRSDYTLTLETGIERFTDALEATDFQLDDAFSQDMIFSKFIAPLLQKNRKTAYILVDALRFEMGRDLSDGLKEEFNVTLTPAITMLPSITSVGMAALLPGAEKGLGLVISAGSKLSIEINGHSIKNRADRIRYFQKHTPFEPVVCKLNQLIKPSKKLQDEIKSAKWFLATSQELDLFAEEGDGEEEVRIFMEEVLDRLSKGIRRLNSLGIDNIVVTADHGHLFGEAIEGGMRMDSPGGDTIEIHGRAWIGKGGAAGEGYIRVSADQLGLGGNVELAFPRSLACFKTKGGTKAYCHGGISFQEMIIPVIHLTPKRSEQTYSKGSVQLQISGSKITNRFFSITALYKEQGLFAAKEIRVKVIIKSGRKEVGSAVMAAYGFEGATKEINLKPNESNPITLILTDVDDITQVSIHMLDAISQVELGRLKDIPVDIAL